MELQRRYNRTVRVKPRKEGTLFFLKQKRLVWLSRVSCLHREDRAGLLVAEGTRTVHRPVKPLTGSGSRSFPIRGDGECTRFRLLLLGGVTPHFTS